MKKKMDKVEIIKTIGTIQDLAEDVKADTARFIIYKDKALYLSEIRDSCEAILGYVNELEKVMDSPELQPTNEERFCQLDTEQKANVLYSFVNATFKVINGKSITNKEEVLAVIMKWLQEKSIM